VVAPFEEAGVQATEPEALRIHQDAWFSLGTLKAGANKTYTIRRPGNGVYLFVIAGQIAIGQDELGARDGAGITETDRFTIEVLQDAELLVMDVPMTLPAYLQGQA
jgi:quercetin 2,3-dioxygenase